MKLCIATYASCIVFSATAIGCMEMPVSPQNDAPVLQQKKTAVEQSPTEQWMGMREDSGVSESAGITTIVTPTLLFGAKTKKLLKSKTAKTTTGDKPELKLEDTSKTAVNNTEAKLGDPLPGEAKISQKMKKVPPAGKLPSAGKM